MRVDRSCCSPVCTRSRRRSAISGWRLPTARPTSSPGHWPSSWPHISESNPTGTIGTPEDVAEAVLFAMTNAFLTGMTLKIDGGEPLT
jgi:NAD(P)-dependent dehydrogenase (short-subunit alcohol dehydrogenase family)